jgi:hypothetical protein
MIAASIGNTHHFDEDEVFIRLPRRIAGPRRILLSHADEADLNPIAF